jgi:cytochrome c oxidase subunit 3/cytochrome o ubiquinol oxidase subunit 3
MDHTAPAHQTLPQEYIDWYASLPSRRKVGMACLILCEAALFTIFVVAFLYYLPQMTGAYPKGLEFPFTASMALFISSFTVYKAEAGFIRKDMQEFRMWWVITIILGLYFLGYTAHEWYELIFVQHVTIGTDLFGSAFYALVGLHASHVIVGLFLLTLVLVLSLFDLVEHDQHERIEMISWYWHFVDGIWVVVLSVVYIIPHL